MTRQEAKELLPIMQAYADGKTIEFWCPPKGWVSLDMDEPIFAQDPDRYRIKPEPKLRPWNMPEVPIGALARKKDGTMRTIICTATPHGTNLGNYADTLRCFEYSDDYGGSWKPCGIIE
jgi:hypothetical protein